MGERETTMLVASPCRMHVCMGVRMMCPHLGAGVEGGGLMGL